ncbi:hypothetical protein D3C76_1095800 [compost metagenome]
MLPDVQAEDRRVAVHQRAVLVTTAFDHQGLGRGHAQPGPAAAETGQRSLGKSLLEGVETTQLLLDGLGHGALWQAPALGRHHPPEQRMVGVAAALVNHCVLQLLRQLPNAGDQFFHRPLRILAAFYRRIEVVDIGLVVLAVVNLHGLSIDVRFQRIVGVGQCRQGVRHFTGFHIVGVKARRFPGRHAGPAAARAGRAGVRYAGTGRTRR